MKKFLLILLLAAVVLPSSAQLLYRISGNGLQKDSYVIGTYHLADASFVDKIPGAREALNSAEQVYGELAMDVTTNPDSMAVMQQMMMLPEGQTLKNVLTEEQLGAVDACFENVLGMKLTNPMMFMQMGKMTPAGISQTLALMVFMKKHAGEFNIQNGIDSYFQTEGARQGKYVGGLETMAFQMSVLFGDSMEDQVKSLMCLVDNMEFSEMQAEELTKAYYAQDFDALMKVFNEKMGNDCDGSEDDMDKTVYNRNDNWIKQMPAIMKEHSTFFAFGAAHLGNERGLIAQLRKLGYSVEPVK